MAVVKISARGEDPGGLVRYMFGKGKGNEHTNQRTVAGTCEYARAGDQPAIRQVHGDLRAYSLANPQVTIKGGHVWQASITLPPGDPSLSDDKWKSIADDYMSGMGFADPAKAPVRWTAINHGLNTIGSDHIHIVMSMVREDGSRVSIHNDAVESSKVMKELEIKHGLTQLAGRNASTAARTFTGGEKGKAVDNNHEIERVEVERIVRGAAAASSTEAEFARRLRGAGMDVRPRVSGDVVTGYSVGMPGTNVHFAGGKIARDLTLPRLRTRWAEKPAGTEAAALEWIHGARGKPLVSTGRETQRIRVSEAAVTKELQTLQEAIPRASTIELREIGQDLSGALALGSRVDPALAKPSRDAGRLAQTRSYSNRPPHRLMNVGLLILQASDPLSPMGTAIMLKQVLSTLKTIHEFHQARCRVALGRGNTMSSPTPDDGINELAEGAAVVAVTVGAQAVQAALYKKKSGLAEGAGGSSPTGPGMVPAAVAGNRQPGRVSSSLPQQQADLLADALGEPRSTGRSEDLRDRVLVMQEALGVDKSKELLHAAGLPYTWEYRGENNMEYQLEYPPNKVLQPVGAAGWQSDPMTHRQRVAVMSYARNAGLRAETDLQGFDGWTKADASEAIGEFQKNARTPEKISLTLTTDAQQRWDPTKIKPRTTATKPGAGPIEGDDIRYPRGRGGR